MTEKTKIMNKLKKNGTKMYERAKRDRRQQPAHNCCGQFSSLMNRLSLVGSILKTLDKPMKILC